MNMFGLLQKRDQVWRTARNTISPTFSASKLKAVSYYILKTYLKTYQCMVSMLFSAQGDAALARGWTAKHKNFVGCLVLFVGRLVCLLAVSSCLLAVSSVWWP